MARFYCPYCGSSDIHSGRSTDWLKDNFTPLHCNICKENFILDHNTMKIQYTEKETGCIKCDS